MRVKNVKRTLSLMMVVVLIISCLAVIPAPQVTLAAATAVGEYDGPDPAKMDMGTFNFNCDWKHFQPASPTGPYITACTSVKQDALNFWDVAYDDSAWSDVSLPHTINDKDAFHSRADNSGDLGTYIGVMFYRKHFKLPEEYAGKKIFIEFEGVRQAAYVYLNGEIVGYYQAGVVAFGFDLSAHNLNFGDTENVLAVGVDSRGMSGSAPSAAFKPPSANNGNTLTETPYANRATPGAEGVGGTAFQWHYSNFNTMQGGINKNVYLHVKEKVFQTLPLYANLKTQGTYIFPTDINVAGRSATINVEAEVRNEDAAKAVTLETVLVNKDGVVVGSFESAPVNVPLADDIAQNKGTNLTIVPSSGTTLPNIDAGWRSATKITASGLVKDLNLWSLDDPYLYDVYTILKDAAGNRLDVRKTTTGFRKVEFRGNNPGNQGGVMLNDKYVWLTGYAQRSTSEWASLGVAPDWLNDYDMGLVKESNANHVRWMHIAPPPALVRATDKYGIAVTVPAGDSEADVTGRQWVQRVELMRNVIIYFRNNPSVFFWEIGNNGVTNQHLRDMKLIKDKLDPIAKGNRAIGCRTMTASTFNNSGVEYASVMTGLGSDHKTLSDAVPFFEAEYMRHESPRRVWDRYSPPDYDMPFIYGGGDGSATTNPMRNGWDLTSEDMVVSGVAEYNVFYGSRVRSGSTTPYYSGCAALCWTDSDQHSRMPASENARMSGRVDAVRVKKPSFYGFQAMQAVKPALYLVGHWTYPDPSEPGAYSYRERSGTAFLSTYGVRDWLNKTVYVVASSSVNSVELFINGVSKGIKSTPSNNFLYSWTGIDITRHGEIYAVGYDSAGKEVCRQTLETTGAPVGVRLTPVTGPKGLIADGNDVVYIDVEVVDDEGRVCPLAYDRINISVSGPGKMLGGYNSGQKYLTEYGSGYNKDYIYAECGSNRIFVRAGRTAGPITVTASLAGKTPATVVVESKPVNIVNGLTKDMPQTLPPENYPWPTALARALQPVIPAAGPEGYNSGGSFDIAPFSLSGGKIDSIDVKTNTALSSEVTFIAGAFDGDGYFRGAGVKAYADPAELPKGAVTTVPLGFTLPAGFNASTWEAKIFTWTSLNCRKIRDDNRFLADYDAASRTGTVSVNVGGSNSMTSMVVLYPGADPEKIKAGDIAFMAQGVADGNIASFSFKLPAGCAVGKYTVIVGSSTQKPVIAGVFNVFASGSPIVKGVYATNYITTDFPAKVKVVLNIQGSGDISVSLFGKSVPVAGNTVFIDLSAAEIPDTFMETTYYAYVYVSGLYTGVRLPVTVVPYDASIWSPSIAMEKGRTLIKFAADIAPNGEYKLYDAAGARISVRQDGRVLIADYDAKTGDILKLDGVIFPKLFKDHSNTFTLVCREMEYVKNLALAPAARARASTNETANGNVAANAIDGSSGSRWAASGSSVPQNLEIDLGAVYELDTIEIYWYQAASRTYDYVIWASNTANPAWATTPATSRNYTSQGYTQVVERKTSQGDTIESLNRVKAQFIAIDIPAKNNSAGYASIHNVIISGWREKIKN